MTTSLIDRIIINIEDIRNEGNAYKALPMVHPDWGEWEAGYRADEYYLRFNTDMATLLLARVLAGPHNHVLYSAMSTPVNAKVRK